MLKCWEFFECDEQECPVIKSKELRCWLVSGTHCRNEIQGKFLEKMEMCLDCQPFKANMDTTSLEETLKVVNEQFAEFRTMVEERDAELQGISMELSLGLSEVFEALKKVSAGDPSVRIPETSGLELIGKLKYMVNLTAQNLAEIVALSHEFAMGLAEHFSVLNEVSRGDLTARVSGASQIELLESLKKVTNQMIESVAQEIAERHRAEEQLRESEERYRKVLEASPDPVVVYDMEGRGRYVNPAFTDVFGWAQEEVLEKRIDYVPDENRPETQRMIEKILAGESFKCVETRRRTKEGKIIDASISAATYLDRKGNLMGSVHILRDITQKKRAAEALREAHDKLERRVEERTAELTKANEQLKREIEERHRAEKELKLSEEKYRLLFNNDPNPLFLIDLDSGKIIDANTPAAVTYQYDRKEIMGMSFLDLFDSDERGRLWDELENSHRDVYVFIPRVSAKKKDDRKFFIHLHASALKLQKKESGDSRRSLIVRTVDITRRLEREALLTQASKMATLGEMATGVAHEINQPLNVLRVAGDFLAKTLKRGKKIPDDELMKVSRYLTEQVDRATQIVNHLRDFGRKSNLEVYPVDLNEPIRDVFTLIGEQLKLRNIKIQLKLDKHLPKVLADKNRLEQIFLNLITNAGDAMEAKGQEATKELTITTYQDEKSVVAEISDTGTGMVEAVQKKIFDPFFTTKEAGKGTGLGLSISYNLVKDFMGNIDVESAPGVGTTFTTRFPIHQERGHSHDEVINH
jgi:PAS domain S-box-containing protein